MHRQGSARDNTSNARRRLRRGSLAVAVSLLTAGVLLSGIASAAAWNKNATGSANGKAGSVGLATGLAVTINSESSLHVAWTAPSGLVPTGYTVRRDSTAVTSCTNISALVCDDTGLNQNTLHSYTVEALYKTWTSGQTGASSNTTSAGKFVLAATSSTSISAGGSVSFTVTATNTAASTADTFYSGAHTVTFGGATSAPDGTAPVYTPASGTSITFTNGVATISAQLFKVETAALTATESGNLSTSSPLSVTVSAGTASGLCVVAASKCSGGTITYPNKTQPVASAVGLVDAHGNPVVATATTNVTVGGISGVGGHTVSPSSYTIATGATQSSQTFTVSFSAGSQTETVTVTATTHPYSSVTATVQD